MVEGTDGAEGGEGQGRGGGEVGEEEGWGVFSEEVRLEGWLVGEGCELGLGGCRVEWMCYVVPHDLTLSDIGIIMSKRIPELPLRVVLMPDFLTPPWACAIDILTILYPALSCISL